MEPGSFEWKRDIAIYWYNKSSDLRGSAAALWVSRSEEMSDAIVAACDLGTSYHMSAAVPAVFKMLAGMSLELLYKAILVAKKLKVPFSHDLEALAEMADVEVIDGEPALLRILTGSIVWAGRYPVPKNEAMYTDHGELVRERLHDRKPFGRSHILSPNNALSWDGYDELWRVAAAVFWQNYKPV